MPSSSSFWDAVAAFFDALGSVGLLALALALVVHTVELVLRSIAWRNIVRVAMDDPDLPLKPVLGALVAGAAVNGVLPARSGDALKLFAVHRQVPMASYPMLATSLVPETLVNAVMATVLFGWAWAAGILPSRPELPGMQVFEISWAARHPWWALLIAMVVVGLLGALFIVRRDRVFDAWHHVEDGLRVLRRPRTYVGSVVSFQLAAWTARVVGAWFFLRAFHVEATLRNALIVVLIGAIGSAMPVTPGGVGPKQALIVAVMAGEASSAEILAFSAGMEVAIVGFQLLLGFAAAAAVLDGLRLRSAVATAKDEVYEIRDLSP